MRGWIIRASTPSMCQAVLKTITERQEKQGRRAVCVLVGKTTYSHLYLCHQIFWKQTLSLGSERLRAEQQEVLRAVWIFFYCTLVTVSWMDSAT